MIKQNNVNDVGLVHLLFTFSVFEASSDDSAVTYEQVNLSFVFFP